MIIGILKCKITLCRDVTLDQYGNLHIKTVLNHQTQNSAAQGNLFCESAFAKKASSNSFMINNALTVQSVTTFTVTARHNKTAGAPHQDPHPCPYVLHSQERKYAQHLH